MFFMKKILNTLFILLAFGIAANAQFNYDLTVRQETYQPLTTGTDITGGNVWDDEHFKVPLGFSFALDGQTITDFSLLSATGCATDTQSQLSAFLLTDLDLQDRGYDSNIAKSPIRYIVSGSAPNRIFKCEVANAGIYDEEAIYGTQDDSVNLQVWLYEGSNILEIHYGPTQLTYPADYFLFTGYPVVGFIRNIDFNSSTGSFDDLYMLQGNANAPIIDSVADIFSISGGLNSYPSSGTVYRFSPKPVSVNGVDADKNSIKLVSNIGSDKVIVKKNNDQEAYYSVLSMNGATMNISGTLARGNNDINISNLPNGMYLLHVQSKSSRQTYRIVKY